MQNITPLNISNHIAFIHGITLLGTYLYDTSGKSGRYFFVFSPRGGKIAEHFIMLVFTPDERSNRRTFN